MKVDGRPSQPKSEFAKGLDEVQGAVHSFLKPLGFRKKGRTHNRATDGGLLHVINFQMGSFPIGKYVIPGLRESFYGKFAVNLGVLLPCVYEVEQQQPPPAFVQEFYCTIRLRLGILACGEDRWFEVGDGTSGLASTVVDQLDRFGLEFFEQFQRYEDVLAYYKAHNELPFQDGGRAALVAALVAHQMRDEELSVSLFEKAYALGGVRRKGFQGYVKEIAARIGCKIG